MRYSALAGQLILAGVIAAEAFEPATATDPHEGWLRYKVKPKIFIISMFEPEADIWYANSGRFNLLQRNITVPGLSPLYPHVQCTTTGDVCQLVTGESEINAACTITALLASPRFDLTATYFLIAGIAGVNPEVATTGSVTFARYAIQVALQYEFDAREIPANWTTGYVPQGAYSPSGYPQFIYGTEVFEVNANLRDLAASFAKTATLNDSSAAKAYRANYASTLAYTAGSQPPSVVSCDVATSDVYFSGALLSQAFANYSTLVTNGSAVYCTTAQEDNATLEALLRGTLSRLVDFSRIIVMRTASDFDRPPAGEAATENLLYADQGGFEIAVQNIYLAGVEVVEGILRGWNTTFAGGVAAGNYVGDILGSLGGTPDFGLPADFIGDQVVAKGNLWRSGRAAGRRRLPKMLVRLPWHR